MTRHTPTIFAVLATLLSCKEASIPIVPIVPPVSQLNQIAYQQIGYDSYSIQHASGAKFTSDQILAISVGELDSTRFIVLDSIVAVWNQQSQLYESDFNAVMPISLNKASVTIRVRYYQSPQTWVDFDTTLSTMTYPYPGTEVLFNIPGFNFTEDIDIADSVIYGQINDFILMYDMKTQTTSQSGLIHSYECLTVVEDRYVFYDHVNWSLYRYDLLTTAIEGFVNLAEGRFMLGLESYNGALYVLLKEPLSTGTSLLKYSLSGELLDSTSINRSVARLTISDGIAYFQWYGDNPIYRYNLSTKTFIDQYKSPSADFEGIRIRHGYFYFSDWDKRVIARFPLEELFLHGQMAPL